MSSHSLRRLRRLQTDGATSRAYAQLTPNPDARRRLDALIAVARARSPLLSPRWALVGHRHPGIEALTVLAQRPHPPLRPLHTWAGAEGPPLRVVHSLAQHLLGRYPVPLFMASAFLAPPGPEAERQRQWVIGHLGGASFRSQAKALSMTRRIEHLFLASAHHLTLPEAYRRAELKSLGAEPALIEALLQTHLREQLANAPFWRSALGFFVRHQGELPLDQVAPLVEFIETVRHRPREVECDEGSVLLPPERPDLTLKGRTPASLQRLAEGWHHSLAGGGWGGNWSASPYRSMTFVEARDPEEGDVLWEVVELTTAAELREEGAQLRHCVGSYTWWCKKGVCRIWSLRRRREGGAPRAQLTLEIRPSTRTIVQARGHRNRFPQPQQLNYVARWARREGLTLKI